MSAVARLLLPVATAVTAALYLAAPAPSQLDLALASALAESPEQADLARCAGGGRGADACLDDVDGKALDERAAGFARADRAAGRGPRP